MPSADLIVCEQCDLVQQRLPCPAHASARCARCGYTLYRDDRYDLESRLALVMASLLVLAIANAYPLMELEVGGRRSEVTLWQMIVATSASNVSPIAAVAAACVLFFPLLQIGLYAYVLWPLLQGRVPPAFAGAMHALRQMQPWIMVEVFMLGMLVSVVKLSALATAAPKAGMWAFAALTVLLTAVNAGDLRRLWAHADALRPPPA